MPRETISTKDAPRAIGPYAQAVAATGRRMVFCSGQISLDPATGEMVGAGDVRAQTDRVMQNLAAVLSAAGASFETVAKTTIFLGPVEEFDTVGALIDSLPSNSKMKAKDISHAPASARVDEEKRNIRVKAFIYAFKKEADNDYHVIIGDAPGTPNLRYFNVEVSGIPIAGTDENRDQLKAVRNTFKEAFNLGASGPGSYHKPNPPVPVRVTGSLFWDVDHQNPPLVGPASHKPKTPFELHPLSAIEFPEE